MSNKKKYRILTFIVSSIICLMVIILNLLSHVRAQEIYLEQTEKTIIDIKKDFLKDTVGNVFLEIDKLRESKYNNYYKKTESILRRFQGNVDLKKEDFLDFFINIFNEDLNSEMWRLFLWNNETGEILYGSPELHIVTIDSTVNDMKSLLSSYVVIEKGNIEGVFGVSKSYIDEIVKKEVEDMIRNRKFSNESYIWVNEVINYEGGKDYAIRKVHPNLKDTEGTYLSTDMEDTKGNLPYLEELEGIKKDGEIFLTYYFKKLNSSTISEKISYAKLYKDYNWIIAMGVNLDEIDDYTEKTNIEINSLSTESNIRLLAYIFLVFIIGFTTLYLVEKHFLVTSTKSYEKEINLDIVTSAFSRRYGENNLKVFYKQYRSEGKRPAIMMFDIDDFKHINDKYGHAAGDIVLIEIVKLVNHFIRSSDQLIRWGGDEFVGILPGLREEHIREFGEKLLTEISSLEIPVDNETISITISIGFSYFNDTDNDCIDVLKRADDAMYKSKEQGKNRINILL